MIPALLFSISMTYAELLFLSVLHFPQASMGIIKYLLHKVVVRIKSVNA